jgi:hypothetical protein
MAFTAPVYWADFDFAEAIIQIRPVCTGRAGYLGFIGIVAIIV